MSREISAFKTYDIRGIYPDQIDQSFMQALAKAYATQFRPKKVVIGYDARLSSEKLADALAKGFQMSGTDVIDIGLCGTEMVYYATGSHRTDGGIMITASHNPKEYNGCKMVAKDGVPVGMDAGLDAIKTMVANDGPFVHVRPDSPDYQGNYSRLDITGEFIDFMLNHITGTTDGNIKVVVNSGNGAAGPTIQMLSEKLACSVEHIFSEPDGNFPNGVPNPLLPEHRDETAKTIIESGADLGVAFDGDFDRCFFFDENGRFIEGYYMVGLIARQILRKKPGAVIIHDPRLIWNTIETVKKFGGTPIESKTGHVFIKESMRREGAEYGGEMSAHHYFRDFWYCDTGIMPFLMILELLSVTGKPLSGLVDEAIRRYPVSGELNFRIREAPEKVLQHVESFYAGQGGIVSRCDGLSIAFDNWRFNLRVSNTESLLRLNVEAHQDRSLMEKKRNELVFIIDKFT